MRLRLKFIFLLILIVPTSMAFSQEKAKKKPPVKGDAEFNIDLRLPTRLIKIDSDINTVRFMDRKSQAVLVIKRNRFSEFSGQTSAQADLMYLDLLGDPNCFDVSQGFFNLKIGDCEIVNWKTKERKEYKLNNQNSLAMLEVGGTIYDFHITHASKEEKQVNSLFKKILNSIKNSNS